MLLKGHACSCLRKQAWPAGACLPAHTVSMGKCSAAGMLVQPANLAQAEQEALLASAFPQLPDAFRLEVAHQTCAGSQAVSAFGHICQARRGPAAPVPQLWV